MPGDGRTSVRSGQFWLPIKQLEISCEKIAILLAQKCPKMDQIPMKKSLVLLASSMAEDGQ